jgi:hypothetical protein
VEIATRCFLITCGVFLLTAVVAGVRRRRAGEKGVGAGMAAAVTSALLALAALALACPWPRALINHFAGGVAALYLSCLSVGVATGWFVVCHWRLPGKPVTARPW